MDPKVTNLMSILNVKHIKDFKLTATYTATSNLKARYSDTTLEDYLWRLLRVLKATPSFPMPITRKYYKLWLSVGGKTKSK